MSTCTGYSLLELRRKLSREREKERQKARRAHYCLFSSSNPFPFAERFHLFSFFFSTFFASAHGLDKSEKKNFSALVPCTCFEKQFFPSFSYFVCRFFFFASPFFLHDFLVPGAPYNNVCEACFVLSFFSETSETVISVFGLAALGQLRQIRNLFAPNEC